MTPVLQPLPLPRVEVRSPVADAVVGPRRIVNWLFGLIVLLVAASLAGQVAKYYFGHDHLLGLVRLFHLDAEANVPTWFSSAGLACCAVLAAIITLQVRRTGGRRMLEWAGISAIFLGLSIDEGAQIHELASPVMGRLGFVERTFSAEWVALAVIVGAVLGIAYCRFFFTLPRATQAHFALGALLYVAGAAGVETVAWTLVDSPGQTTFVYELVATLEEALEMTAIVIFLRGLLLHLAANFRDFTVRFARD
ncbi:MAG: hypothetical protein KIT09_07995 [Bryobacteraceae bacterium]|nr:hypothetical protein [Bryobacteraceae bacterium]